MTGPLPMLCDHRTGGRSYMVNEQFTWLTPFTVS